MSGNGRGGSGFALLQSGSLINALQMSNESQLPFHLFLSNSWSSGGGPGSLIGKLCETVSKAGGNYFWGNRSPTPGVCPALPFGLEASHHHPMVADSYKQLQPSSGSGGHVCVCGAPARQFPPSLSYQGPLAVEKGGESLGE